MKINLLFTIFVFIMANGAAASDLQPLPASGEGGRLASIASSIHSVQDFTDQEIDYKVTVLDASFVEGKDFPNYPTAIVCVHKGQIGSGSGCEAAFLIAPNFDDGILGINSVEMVDGNLQFSIFTDTGIMHTLKYKYDSDKKLLREVN